MSVIRFLFAGGLAAVVTASLVFLMHVLIQTNIKAPEKGREYKIPDMVMPDREIVTEYDTSKPDRPDEVDEPPPEMPDIEFDTPDVTNEGPSISGPKIEKPKVAGPSGIGGDGEYIPITKVQPQYPSRAASRGIEGYCTVIYDVTEIGSTENVRGHDCPQKVFLRASIKAAGKFKYKPRVIDGKAVKVQDIQNKFTFELAK